MVVKYDITVQHPEYAEYAPAWKLMRDCFDGEDEIKEAGEKYLPMKSGTASIKDIRKRDMAYQAYVARAEFPELVAPTVRGSVGVLLKKPAVIELPKAMDPLREKATLDGLTLEGLHRRIATELALMGRYGLLPGITKAGEPYLAGYITESIVNWDTDADDNLNYLVLDECTLARDLESGKWGKIEQYRECKLDDAGQFVSQMWKKNKDNEFVPTGPEVVATTRAGAALDFIPFVFIGTNDLVPCPDDVPLYGLGRLCVRVYRLDADYVFALHMTSEPTPVVTGFPDPVKAQEEGQAPTAIGASALWILPPGSEAKFLEFTGAGIDAQQKAINDALNRAIAYGAQLLTDTQRTAESGEAIRLRLGNQTSLLQMIAVNSAAGLEKALRNIARWIGEDENAVKVTPNLEFFSEPLTAQDITALVMGWQQGAYSYNTMFDRMKRGGLVPEDRTAEEEQGMIAADPFVPSDSAPLPAVGGRSSSASQTSPLGVPDGP